MKRALVVLFVVGIALSAFAGTAEKKAMAVKADEAVISNGHLLHIEGATAYYCTCGKDCKCTLAEDKSQCTCGKEIQKVDIAGKYYCAKCDSAISDKPGKCAGCEDELTEAK